MNTAHSKTAPVDLDAPTSSGSRCDPSTPQEQKGSNIMAHTPDEATGLSRECAPWCVDEGHRSHDPACWGGPDRYVYLTMEEGYPCEALPGMEAFFDPPRIGPHTYRQQPGYRSVVKLHLYRPHENRHIDLDDDLKLTADEARQLAADLITVAAEIDGVPS